MSYDDRKWSPTFGAPRMTLEAVERAIPGPRQGLPEPKPYVWREAARARDAEVEAQIASARAKARRRA